MKNEPHKSSANKITYKSSIKYKKQDEVTTFTVGYKAVTSADPYPPTTIKVGSSLKNGEHYTAKFPLNVQKIAKEEMNYRNNQKLSGRIIKPISTRND